MPVLLVLSAALDSMSTCSFWIWLPACWSSCIACKRRTSDTLPSDPIDERQSLVTDRVYRQPRSGDQRGEVCVKLCACRLPLTIPRRRFMEKPSSSQNESNVSRGILASSVGRQTRPCSYWFLLRLRTRRAWNPKRDTDKQGIVQSLKINLTVNTMAVVQCHIPRQSRNNSEEASARTLASSGPPLFVLPHGSEILALLPSVYCVAFLSFFPSAGVVRQVSYNKRHIDRAWPIQSSSSVQAAIVML